MCFRPSYLLRISVKQSNRKQYGLSGFRNSLAVRNDRSYFLPTFPRNPKVALSNGYPVSLVLIPKLSLFIQVLSVTSFFMDSTHCFKPPSDFKYRRLFDFQHIPSLDGKTSRFFVSFQSYIFSYRYIHLL